MREPMSRWIQNPGNGLLTARQQQVLSFVAHSAKEKGYPPSLREIADRLGVHDHKSARDHVEALIKKGYLTRDFGVGRGLRVLMDPHPGASFPPPTWGDCGAP